MKVPPILSIVAATVLLALGIWHFFLVDGQLALRKEAEIEQDKLAVLRGEIQTEQGLLQAQQQKITSSAQLSKELGPAILRDLGSQVIATKNEKIRALLSKHGLNVSENTAPATDDGLENPPVPELPAQ